MRAIYLVLLLLMQACTSSAQTFQGVWKGDLEIQGQHLPLIFELAKTGDKWHGYMQSPAQSLTKLPISTITISGDSIAIRLDAIGLAYDGVIGSNAIIGSFKQGTFETAMKLHKSEDKLSQKSSVRTQIVLPPYGYDTTNVKIKNNYDNIVLAGTMTAPRKKGKYPAVLLLTGSGPQNRDEELFGHKPFKVLADYLTRNGIVVLRIDDRGVGESTGDFSTSTIENFSKDAISAFDYLKGQSQVDKKKVGIIGHSEGGLIAELLAGQHLPDLAFIVSLAGPSFSIDKIMVEQLYAIGKASGMSEQDLAKARMINSRNFAVVKSDLNTQDAYQQLLENMSQTDIGNSNKQMERELLTMLAPAYRYFMCIEPEQYISQINIPVFAAFGTLDVQVPSAQNLKSLYDLLPQNSKTVLKEYKDLNHLFQKATTGQLSEYMEIEETMNPQVMKDIATWIKVL